MDLDRIKRECSIVEVVNEDIALKGRGRWWRGQAHDSLVVDAHRGTYHWNSRDEWGDVIAWVEKRRKMDFKGAVEWLCRWAGLPLPVWKEKDAEATRMARARADALTVACRYWARALRESETGMAYARGRGWTDETIQAAGLGFVVDGDRKALAGELRMHNIDGKEPVARAILSAPAGHLIYPHVWQGRVIYFSTRAASDEEKAHWNPPADWIGKRQVFYNHEYHPVGQQVVVVVEGQADAVTLAQWGVASVALAGVALADTEATTALLRRLGRHQVVLGLDTDEAGQANVAKVAGALGPMTRIVRWPKGDANAWLQSGAGQEDVEELLDAAATWIERVCKATGQAGELEREEALRQAFTLIARMDDFAVQMLRPRLAKLMDVPLRQFNALLKAARGEIEAAAGDDRPPVLVEVPGAYVGEHLLEMVVIPPENGDAHSPQAQWETRFACRMPDRSLELIDYLDMDGVRFVPVTPSSRMLREGVVQFPSALGEPRTLRELAEMVRKTIRKYVDVDVFYEHIATYYVLFTWLYDAFNTVPYLRMLGDAGTGKSRFIQVVGAMCYRPTFVTGAATVSPIFRILDRYRGTLILDEGDYAQSDEAADIIKILNTGYQRVQGIVLRSGDKNTGFQPEVFVVYGPKVIATRKRFTDWALESRCLTNEAGGPTMRTDIPIDLPRDFWDVEAVAVRNALLRYRLENWMPEIELDYEQAETSVEPRLNQVTIALQTLIDDPDLQGDLRSFIKEYNRQLVVERGMTLAAKVLEALVGLREMEQGQGKEALLTVGKVARAVNVLIDTENAGKDEVEEDEGKDKKKVNAHKIGHIVRKQLHLKTERSTEAGRAYVIAWDAGRITALRKRFGLDDDWVGEVTMVLRKAFYPDAPADENIPPEADQDDWDGLF